MALPPGTSPLGRSATVGMRRVHHVLIERRPTGVTCTLTGVTRRPVRRRLDLATALALADVGIPTFLVDRTGG